MFTVVRKIKITGKIGRAVNHGKAAVKANLSLIKLLDK
jgi:hypothetical protein